MTVKKALLAATILALPVAAQAQPVSGLYVGAGAGLNFHQQSSGPDGSAAGKVNFVQPGAAAVAALGWGFGNGLRAEIEGNYRANDVDKVSGSGLRASSTGGYLYNYGVMGNLLFDISTGTPFTPYIGAGAGYGWVESNKFRATGTIANGQQRSITSNDVDGQFAYQGIAGIGYSLGAMVPGLTLTAEYRFFGTLDPSLKADVRTGTQNGVVRTAGRVEIDNYNHSAMLGLRYAFNQPAPAPVLAPVVAPPPAVARTYLVFFDWNKADLTDRAKQIIGEAAGASRRVQTTKIEVAGHADRSGSPQYNQRLSERRAEAVAAELVRQGIARSEIAISAYGESRPLVPTADGVREPQNRRVEIVLK